MAARANWKGYLKLSLVSCAVALHPAVSTAQRVRFNILSKATGHRVRNEVVDSETGDPVPEEERVKGYRLDDGSYVALGDEDFDQVALESTHTLDIETFVPAAEIDPIYFDTPYFLVPDDDIAQEAYAVIRDAMAAEQVVGLARVVLYRRERIVLVAPRGRGLMVRALHYKTEVRDECAAFEAIDTMKVAPDMLDLAVHIVRSKAGHFETSTFEDRYDAALMALIRAKQEGRPPPPAPEPGPGNVISLMEALRRSVKAGAGAPAPAARAEAAGKAKRTKRARSPAERSVEGGADRTSTAKPTSTKASGKTARSSPRKRLKKAG
ncbi:Ku protein [Rhodoplanes sp. TEM]|uniref:Non-homologous end joining protein Ku n=1 Tax=Rhodoplanes tepidamans TaxID=200616 RepID=A0ABT5J716_RHOTP|nr:MULTISPECIES: Ku protein [Rhodoplanes]MDC7785446.1 Ku protein [Rhodoplanes tepidamans]MDC7985773.1 Ku protein [Rhodoplanes sp. TEM]MDQ0353100.1 DNA end-binding protein Ku [Rhodoplanes tepidamans]